MELRSVVEFLEKKTILVTGATGFLAKVFLEKILRVQPNVKKIYVLIRASDVQSATLRFYNEVLGKDLFRIIKEKWGAQLNSFISEKITIVPGDIACEDFGLKDSFLKQEMCNDLDIIVNSAAVTNFYERYDVLLGINTFGAMHIVKFANKCVKLKVLLHVSTAYVAWESGLILEDSYQMGITPNGERGLNIDMEKKVVEQQLNQLKEKGASKKEITHAMKDLGIQRARIYGWPTTYLLTKAMGEMVIQQYDKEKFSVVTIRPTIVTSSHREPFPGWLDSGSISLDVNLCLLQAQGKLPFLVGDPMVVSDFVPVDMVANAMIVAMVTHAKQYNFGLNNIYQVGSSLRNPVKSGAFFNYCFEHFTKKSWNNNNNNENVSKITFLNSMDSFYKHMAAITRSFKGKDVDGDMMSSGYANFLTTLVKFSRPYLFFNGIFDDKNTEKLRMAVRESGVETDIFYFDPSLIDWKDYFMNAHLPGVDKVFIPSHVLSKL
ncbi:Fatty acyl-CoA reductase [Melia azedarach]|uniref:Fatty acyl-CoA reductase n=1 Tax=Melia azedarach TaxID=155640 RepID=A0ACC1X7P9_MELAZ|nr:Fatty acyl-CoA reductase [Melia azedarach]